jgi:tetratricopeptide (TPR) repeat protein
MPHPDPAAGKMRARHSPRFEQAVAMKDPARIDKAAAELEKIVKTGRDDARAAFELGVLRFLQNRRADAYRHFALAGRLAPTEPVIRANLAATAFALGRHEEAIGWCDNALALGAEPAKAWNMRGNALRALGRLEEALRCCERALELRPDFVEAWSDCGAALTNMRRLDAALAATDKALSLRPDSAPLHCNRAAALIELDRAAEALLALDKALALAPPNVIALNNRASALKLLNRMDEALLCCEASLALDRDHAAPWLTRADVLCELGRPDEALASFQEGLARDPHNVAGLANMSQLLADLGRFPEATAMLRKAIELAPCRANLYYNLAQLEKLTPGDPAVAALREQAEAQGLSAKDLMFTHYALAKVGEDNGDREAEFRHLAAGSALKRGLTPYDEAAELGEIAKTMEIFDEKMFSLLAGGGERSLAPIFIVGMPRSGSTLVEQILASHEGVRGLGEVAAFSAAMNETAPRRAGHFANFARELTRETVDAIGAAYARRVGRLAAPGQRVVDKSLDNLLRLGLIALALPSARIIHTRRDPVETCLSCYAKWFNAGYGFSYDLGDLGRYYRAQESLMRHWSEILPKDSLLSVDHEAVVADIEGQSRRIAAFCGLEWNPRCLDFHKTERPVRTASKMQVRQPLFDAPSRRAAAWAGHLDGLMAALAQSNREASASACQARAASER